MRAGDIKPYEDGDQERIKHKRMKKAPKGDKYGFHATLPCVQDREEELDLSLSSS